MKKILSTLLAVIMLFALTACGGSEEEVTTTELTTESTTEETTTEAPVTDGPVTSSKGNVTVTPAGDWEYKGLYSPTMMEFTNKAVAGACVYISDKEDMEYEVQKKTVGYAYPDKAFDEVKIGDITFEHMQGNGVEYLIAPTSNGYAIYIQIRGCTTEDATALLETLEIK